MIRHALIPVCSLLFSHSAFSAVKMPAVFGDHMVLQQDGKIPVWGWADAGEEVTVTLGGSTVKAKASATGEWRVDLAPLPATAAPVELVVKSPASELKFTDVLIGDVWLCSGQSNMEWQLSRSHTAQEDLPLANDPQIRIFQIPRTHRAEVQKDVEAKWVVCTPATAAGFSAAAYYFAQDLRKSLNRPIGLIGSYWGGTPAQSWISQQALEMNPPFTGYAEQATKNLQNYLQLKDAYPALLEEFKAAKQKWDNEVKPGYIPILKAWEAEAKTAKEAGAPAPPRPEPAAPEPKAPRDPNGGPQQSTALYNGMIAPLIPYSIKGAIWYQGESNAKNAGEYQALFSRMITDWRTRWGRGDFPFIFVQLASYGASRPPENYEILREQQLKTLALPNTGMAVAIDIGAGKDIHPPNKKDIGLRLALAARHIAYGEKIEYSGPIYQAMKVQGNKVVLAFNHIGSGLKIGTPPWRVSGAPPVPDTLSGFTICGADRKWVPAEARIEGKYVFVASKEVAAPVAVRYGWEGDPICNLYNNENLPASPFRTDDWPHPVKLDGSAQ